MKNKFLDYVCTFQTCYSFHLCDPSGSELRSLYLAKVFWTGGEGPYKNYKAIQHRLSRGGDLLKCLSIGFEQSKQ